MKGCCNKLKEDFTEHPALVGETYLEHMWCCVRISLHLLCIIFILLIHGIFPFMFERTGSSLLSELHETMQERINYGKETGERPDPGEGQ